MANIVDAPEFAFTLRGHARHTRDELVDLILQELQCYPGVEETIKEVLESLSEIFISKLRGINNTTKNLVCFELEDFLTYILNRDSLKKKNKILIETILGKLVLLGYLRKEYGNDAYFMGSEFNVFQKIIRES
jgi:hypothetical protein